MRHGNLQLAAHLAKVKKRRWRPEYRFFPIKNTAGLGAPAHQVLRTLEDEVPAQVGENSKIHAAKMRVTAGPVVTKEKSVTQTL
jgi:hypothetical protein